MCIYLGNNSELTYETREHIIPAALGCCTKLKQGMVSDQANKFFSSIERNVLERSFLQIPRIIQGPGKRGKLSPKYAITSEVSVIQQDGYHCLGYMKGTEGFILSQFIVEETNNIQFTCNKDPEIDLQREVEVLRQHILEMDEKYVAVNMLEESTNRIFITFYKEKIHIGCNGQVSKDRVNEIKALFHGPLNGEHLKTVMGQLTARIEIEDNFRNLCKVVAKTAVNTLAYIMGATYIEESSDFDDLIKMILSEDDKILSRVFGLGNALNLKKSLHLNDEQHCCLILPNSKELIARVFFYESCFEVILCHNRTTPFSLPIEGIVCDWKNRKDYRYLDYLTEIGVLKK